MSSEELLELVLVLETALVVLVLVAAVLAVLAFSAARSVLSRSVEDETADIDKVHLFLGGNLGAIGSKPEKFQAFYVFIFFKAQPSTFP